MSFIVCLSVLTIMLLYSHSFRIFLVCVSHRNYPFQNTGHFKQFDAECLRARARARVYVCVCVHKTHFHIFKCLPRNQANISRLLCKDWIRWLVNTLRWTFRFVIIVFVVLNIRRHVSLCDYYHFFPFLSFLSPLHSCFPIVIDYFGTLTHGCNMHHLWNSRMYMQYNRVQKTPVLQHGIPILNEKKNAKRERASCIDVSLEPKVRVFCSWHNCIVGGAAKRQ